MKKNDGKNFELQTKMFFSYLFGKIGYTVHKERMQFNGTQDGFDVQFIISDDYIERKIFIECKDYSTDLKFGNLYAKSHDLEANYEFDKNDVVFFISPRANFSNGRNAEKSEPVFNNGKFPFLIRQLDLSNGIETLFGINKSIFKEIYKYDCTTIINEEEEINKFKSILQSRGVLKKIIIKEKHRYDYITDIQKLKNLIPRTVSEPKYSKKGSANPFHVISSLGSRVDLQFLTSSVLTDEKTDGIVLLGNPGLGKSIELKQLAIHYWKNRESENCIPFFRSINSFLASNSIVDYLPDDWQHIPQLLIILDGLDEISEIQTFKAKLDRFIIEQKSKATKIKFILSCRTNIYESIIKDIPNFKCYFLNEIRPSEAFSFLENKYSLSYESINKSPILDNQRDFLANPYFLNLFGEYYQATNSIPTNKCDLIGRYIEKRLEEDRKSKYKNQNYDSSVVKSYCKKAALSMEAMQVNKIEDSYLNILLESKSTFTDSCFVEKIYNEDYWKFEHRNLQEFFVAMTLSNLSFKKILEFIRIDSSIEKTHPSWLNSISFLINLLDIKSDKYNKLINWLKQYNSDVLFKTDSNRISKKIRITVFQDFFNKRCKEQTLWVGVHTSETKELSRFGDCVENIEFLITEVENINNHRRVRISALNLISYMDLFSKKDEVKSLIIKLLSSSLDEVDFRFKADAISFIKNIGWQNDSEFIHKVISTLGNYDYHLVTSAVLRLIDENNSDAFFDYIKITAPKVIEDDKRNYIQKDILSTSSQKDTLKNILLKFNELEHLIFSLEIYFKNEYHYAFDTKVEEVEQIIFKIIKIQDKNTSAYDRMIEFIINGFNDINFSFAYEEALCFFFLETDTNEKAFNDLFNAEINYPNNIGFGVKRHFLASLATHKNIKTIAHEFIRGNIDEKEITYFRNSLPYDKYELIKELENIIINETSFNFNGNLTDKKIRQKWSNFHKSKGQVGFDLLFSKAKIINKTTLYFSESIKKIITRKDLKDEKDEYWKSVDLQTKYPQSFMYILHDALSEFKEKISQENVVQLLDSELYLINKIKSKVYSESNQFTISDNHITFIKDWCNDNVSKADFNNLYNSDLNKLRCELLWYFRNRFEFTYPEKALLDMLNIDGAMKTNEKDVGYDYIVNSVDRKKLDERIIQNLNERTLTDNIFKNQALYAIREGLKSTFSKIREYLKDESRQRYYRKSVLHKYIEKTNDINLLKELFKPSPVDEYKDDLTWEAITMLLQKNENDFVIKELLAFRKIDKASKNKLTIIKYLIRANYESAFKLFNEWIVSEMSEYKKELHYSIGSEDWNMYHNPKSISDLIELIKIGNNTTYRFDEYSKPIRIASDTLKNICQKNSPKICLEVIQKIKNCQEEIKETDYDTFYFNTIINDTWETYYKLKSKPISFSEIAKKMENYKYEIL